MYLIRIRQIPMGVSVLFLLFVSSFSYTNGLPLQSEPTSDNRPSSSTTGFICVNKNNACVLEKCIDSSCTGMIMREPGYACKTDDCGQRPRNPNDPVIETITLSTKEEQDAEVVKPTDEHMHWMVPLSILLIVILSVAIGLAVYWWCPPKWCKYGKRRGAAATTDAHQLQPAPGVPQVQPQPSTSDSNRYMLIKVKDDKNGGGQGVHEGKIVKDSK